MHIKEFWISNTVLLWPNEYSSGSILDDDHKSLKRSHELWQHANSILLKNPTELSRIDAISTLKRSLNHRLKLIEALYLLKTISNNRHNNGYLGLLEDLGVIRSSMLKKFMDIRNDIEHHDLSPPELSRCMEFSDLIWYLLKSTDEVVRVRRKQLFFKKNNSDLYNFTIEIDYAKSHALELNGWFSEEDIHETKTVNCTKLCVTAFRSIQDFRKIEDKSEADMMLSLMLLKNSFRKDQDIYLTGTLKADTEIKSAVMKSILTAI